ncbi:helix-turn-helix transcriptional regulator [Polaribacter batillariae]|uniref:Helix-turn-helix transcriptional regulator n=1 Tax=Polaribacter batillariae TaxID=2808900 RepID=A0ABX7SSY7_9FLAO|nr:helix-turn-helix transcriptional regulator [Polaribacter batillariae]QTD37359.1 helix-turn-helix transcriptional regulator [Polaribacter batillariae]
MTEIGKRIKEIRLKKGLSQEELAEASKVNLRTIQRIENNETKPREKTLQLIFNALEIEIIEREKKRIDKYLIWSTFLTFLIIICSLLPWTRFFNYFLNGKRIYRNNTGWNGQSITFNYSFPHWLISLSAISIGLIAISHSLGLIKNKKRYILIQSGLLIWFLLGLFNYSFTQGFDLRPGLFITIIATILLIFAYKKKEKLVLTPYKINCWF